MEEESTLLFTKARNMSIKIGKFTNVHVWLVEERTLHQQAFGDFLSVKGNIL